MPSLTTVVRALVMIVTGLMVVKGWQLYGPSTEQVRTFAVAALEKAQAAWNESAENSSDAQSTPVDPRTNAPDVVMQGVPVATTPTPIATAPQLVPLNTNADVVTGARDAASAPATLTATPAEDAVAKLLTQLEVMGVADAQVAPWGTSGGLYRCCCRAKLAETSVVARHFEAVADNPTAAVEQVAAKVEAWRTEQTVLR
jgi:cytoskeletal protein RodZ